MGSCQSQAQDNFSLNFCSQDNRNQGIDQDQQQEQEINQEKSQHQSSKKVMSQLDPLNQDQEQFTVQIEQLQKTQKAQQEIIPEVSDISDNYSVISQDDNQEYDDQNDIQIQEDIFYETGINLEKQLQFDQENPGKLKLNNKFQASKNKNTVGFQYNIIEKNEEVANLKQLIFNKPTEMQEIIDQLPKLPQEIKLNYNAREYKDKYFYIQPTAQGPGYIYRGQWGKFIRQNQISEPEEKPNGFGEQFYFIQKKKLHVTNANKYSNQFVLNIYYIGDIIEGQANGYGKMIQQDGTYYEGNFYANKFHGQGILKKQGGFTLEGNFKDGELDGVGTETWPDGSVYKGNFKNGKKNGEGTFSWKGYFVENERYWGEFVNNQIDGFGVYTWRDGRQYKGYWKGGKMDGYGEFHWPNGSVYKGFYQNNQKQGYGIIYFEDHNEESNKHYWEGFFENGKLSKTDGFQVQGKNGQKVSIGEIIGTYVKGEFAYIDKWVKKTNEQENLENFPQIKTGAQQKNKEQIDNSQEIQKKQLKRKKGEKVLFSDIHKNLLKQRIQIQKIIDIDREETDGLNASNQMKINSFNQISNSNIQNQIVQVQQNVSMVEMQLATGYLINVYQAPVSSKKYDESLSQIQFNEQDQQNQEVEFNQNDNKIQNKQETSDFQVDNDQKFQTQNQVKIQEHLVDQNLPKDQQQQKISSGNTNAQPTQFKSPSQQQKDFNFNQDFLSNPHMMDDSKQQLKQYQNLGFNKNLMKNSNQSQNQISFEQSPQNQAFQINKMSSNEKNIQSQIALNKNSTREVSNQKHFDYKQLTLLFQDDQQSSHQQKSLASKPSSDFNQSIKSQSEGNQNFALGGNQFPYIQDQIKEQVELENRHSSNKQEEY